MKNGFGGINNHDSRFTFTAHHAILKFNFSSVAVLAKILLGYVATSKPIRTSFFLFHLDRASSHKWQYASSVRVLITITPKVKSNRYNLRAAKISGPCIICSPVWCFVCVCYSRNSTLFTYLIVACVRASRLARDQNHWINTQFVSMEFSGRFYSIPYI